ncbi:MAG: hypothetical protein KJO05_06195 [Bacteroidia bacterium]|nr:hypothetical protein [Bacteroidia bacterium]NNK55383.1 hypothetical protein [Flavobacteriaceae bacterium]
MSHTTYIKSGKLFDSENVFKPVPISSLRLKAYQGKYRLSHKMVIAVTKNGKYLKAKADSDEYPFLPKSSTVFQGHNVNPQPTYN